MLSEKMLSLGKNRSVIREIFEYSLRRRAEIGDDKVFDFSLGNPSVPPPEKVGKSIIRLLSEKDPVSLHGYTSAAGDPAVKAKIAENIKNRYGFPASAELIYMTCGAAASLSIVLKALLNPGDEVIIPAPFFPEYRVFTEAAGGKAVIVRGNEKDFALDPEAIASAVTDKTRAVIINSPNNPSGAVYKEEALSRLSKLLSERESNNQSIAIIADEPYREIVYDNAAVPYIPNIYPNTIVCYSYSKSLSLPGERIGYICVSPDMRDAEDIFAAVCGAGRSLGYVCAPSLMQRVVAECDGISPNIEAYDSNRRLLYEGVLAAGYECVKPEGAFYLFIRALEPDASAFCERAKKHELLLVPSDDFGVSGYVRAAYCVDRSVIERSLPAFAAVAREYGRI